MIEIERKFLVHSEDYKILARARNYIAQGYLNSDPERTVRVRLAADRGFLTIKGKSSSNGLTRFEWETPISLEHATSLLALCEPGMIEKYRYEVLIGNHLFEIDEFEGENLGLVVAEIELSHEDEEFPIPDWLGKEVTGDTRYYNASLSKAPFRTWNERRET